MTWPEIVLPEARRLAPSRTKTLPVTIALIISQWTPGGTKTLSYGPPVSAPTHCVGGAAAAGATVSVSAVARARTSEANPAETLRITQYLMSCDCVAVQPRETSEAFPSHLHSLSTRPDTR